MNTSRARGIILMEQSIADSQASRTVRDKIYSSRLELIKNCYLFSIESLTKKLLTFLIDIV